MSIFFWFPIVSGSCICFLSIIFSILFQPLVRKNGKKCYNSLHFINLCLNSFVVLMFSMVKNPSSVFASNWIVLLMFLFWISNRILYGESSNVKLSVEIWYAFSSLMLFDINEGSNTQPPARFFYNFKCNFISTILIFSGCSFILSGVYNTKTPFSNFFGLLLL